MGIIFGIFLLFYGLSVHIQGQSVPKFPEECNGEEYLTPIGYPLTCCRGQSLSPGLSLETYWSQCATPNDSEPLINATLWRVYSCIVRRHLSNYNLTLTLENFAYVMTKRYPSDLRLDIFDKICKMSDLAFDSEDEIETLKWIRRKYYQLEIDVCTMGNSSAMEKMKMYPTYETIYMRGGHCPFDVPIRPLYSPRANETAILSIWTTLLETVGADVISKSNNSALYRNNIYRACQHFLSWIAQEDATADEIFSEPDFTKIFMRLRPSWANSNVTTILKSEVDRYLISEYEAVKEGEKFFESKLRFEFGEIKDKEKAKAMMTSCLIPVFMMQSMSETFKYKLCRP